MQKVRGDEALVGIQHVREKGLAGGNEVFCTHTHAYTLTKSYTCTRTETHIPSV
jgi:hypothetical protein